MDTFLLAWGFLGLCLLGSGGTAETGKAPAGAGDGPGRAWAREPSPPAQLSGARARSRAQARRLCLASGMAQGVNEGSAAPRSFRSTGFGGVGGGRAFGGAGMAQPLRQGAQRVLPRSSHRPA